MLIKFQALCNTDKLVKSVIDVYIIVSDPGSDRWLTNSSFRDSLLDQIKSAWTKRSGLSRSDFPFTSSIVLDCWVQWRKTTPENQHLTKLSLAEKDHAEAAQAATTWSRHAKVK